MPSSTFRAIGPKAGFLIFNVAVRGSLVYGILPIRICLGREEKVMVKYVVQATVLVFNTNRVCHVWCNF